MLHSDWVLLAGVATLLTAVCVIRLTADRADPDNSHVLGFVLAVPLNAVTAMSSYAQDFACTGGPSCVNGVQTYYGEWWMALVFFGMMGLSLGGALISAAMMLNIRRQLFID